jgi:hypothetical protein
MNPAFLRALLIAFTALLGGFLGAAVGLVVGPVLVLGAFDYRIIPEYRLTLGAFGFVVWTPLAAVAAAKLLDARRPIRGTAVAAGNALRLMRDDAAKHAADPVRARRRLRRMTALAVTLWTASAATLITAAYLQHVVAAQPVAYRIAFATYELDFVEPQMQSLTVQERRNYAMQLAYGLISGSRFLFWLITAGVFLMFAAALTSLGVTAASRRATLAQLRSEFALIAAGRASEIVSLSRPPADHASVTPVSRRSAASGTDASFPPPEPLVSPARASHSTMQ